MMDPPRFRACTRSSKFTPPSDRSIIHTPSLRVHPIFPPPSPRIRSNPPSFFQRILPKKEKGKGTSLFFVRSLVYHSRSTKLASQFCIPRFSLPLVPEFLKRSSSIVKASLKKDSFLEGGGEYKPRFFFSSSISRE